MTDTPPSPSQPSGPHCDCGDSGICRPGCPRYEQKMAAQPSGPSIEEQIAAVDRARMTRRHQAQFDNGLSYGANLEADALVEALATLRAHEAQSRELAETRAEIERLTSFISSDNLEACAEAAHEAWLAEKRRRGVTSWPNERGFEQMVSYADCSDDIKEFDRVVVKAIIARLRAPSGKDAMEVALHPDTARLVDDFAAALTAKLTHAEEKYGYANDWLTQDWELECRQHLLDHIRKGDPLDVAAYCAFMWRKGWSTAGALPEIESKETTHSRYYNAFHAWFITGDCDFWSECDAPEQLASIAVELNDQYAARAIGFARAETEARFRPLVEAGWKEATIAWSVCASIHREYGKRRDALYTTRQADFLKHETDARAALAALKEGNQR